MSLSKLHSASNNSVHSLDSFKSASDDSIRSFVSNIKAVIEEKADKPAIARPKDACKHLGIGRTLLWRLEQTDPDFPKKIVFSARAVGWKFSDLDAYLAKKAGC